MLDRANNKITMFVDHFTDYALTGSPPETTATPSQSIFVPVVMKARPFASGW